MTNLALRGGLWQLLLCCCALTPLLVPAVASPTVTVKFTLTMPNLTYPLLGEFWQGTLTYNATLNSIESGDGFPLGYNLVNITGTRTVYTATLSNPSTYQLNSTANIVGLLPANNCYSIYNTSVILGPGVQPTSCVSEAEYDAFPDFAVGYAS